MLIAAVLTILGLKIWKAAVYVRSLQRLWGVTFIEASRRGMLDDLRAIDPEKTYEGIEVLAISFMYNLRGEIALSVSSVVVAGLLWQLMHARAGTKE